MSENTVEPARANERWPSFSLNYTFNPDGLVGREYFGPDELVIFDARNTDAIGSAWLSAEREAYVSIEDVR